MYKHQEAEEEEHDYYDDAFYEDDTNMYDQQDYDEESHINTLADYTHGITNLTLVALKPPTKWMNWWDSKPI